MICGNLFIDILTAEIQQQDLTNAKMPDDFQSGRKLVFLYGKNKIHYDY